MDTYLDTQQSHLFSNWDHECHLCIMIKAKFILFLLNKKNNNKKQTSQELINNKTKTTQKKTNTMKFGVQICSKTSAVSCNSRKIGHTVPDLFVGAPVQNKVHWAVLQRELCFRNTHKHEIFLHFNSEQHFSFTFFSLFVSISPKDNN